MKITENPITIFALIFVVFSFVLDELISRGKGPATDVANRVDFWVFQSTVLLLMG
jgi:hypothetical protein